MRTHLIARSCGVLALLTAVVACSSSQHVGGATTVASTTSTTVAVTAAPPSVATTMAPTVAPTSTSTTVAPTTVAPTVPPGPVPGVVTITYAGSGGGSGELEVDWNAATNAVSYRVYRATAAGGPFTLMVNVNVVSGAITVHDGVINVWGDHQTFVPGPYVNNGVSTHFHYVELDIGGGPHVYYRVIAYNANGRGPIGSTVCAQIYMQPAC